MAGISIAETIMMANLFIFFCWMPFAS